MQLNQPAASTHSSYGRRIASAQNINANSLASTVLSFEPGLSLSNSMPAYIIIKYNSGTFTLAVARLKIGSVVLSSLLALNGLALGNPAIANILTTGWVINALVDNLQVEVTTINGSSSSFNIEVFGFVYS